MHSRCTIFSIFEVPVHVVAAILQLSQKQLFVFLGKKSNRRTAGSGEGTQVLAIDSTTQHVGGIDPTTGSCTTKADQQVIPLSYGALIEFVCSGGYLWLHCALIGWPSPADPEAVRVKLKGQNIMIWVQLDDHTMTALTLENAILPKLLLCKLVELVSRDR